MASMWQKLTLYSAAQESNLIFGLHLGHMLEPRTGHIICFLNHGNVTNSVLIDTN